MSLSIQLDRSGNVLYPGDSLSGKIVLMVSEPLVYRKIFIVFRGDGMCTWKSGRIRFRTTYDCFTLRCDLLTGPLSTQEPAPPGKNEFTLPPSTYEFPFEFHVPSGHLPSTFKDNWGFDGAAYIRYCIEAKVERPWKFNITGKRVIVIHDLVNLNLIRNVGAPMRRNDEKTICCCCCATGPITMEGKIDKGGYICGEKICITLNVQNGSTKELSGVKASLYRQLVYSCRGNTKFRTQCIRTLTSEERIAPGGIFSWNQKQLTVPNDLLPTSSACPCIAISYYLVLAAKTPAYSLDAKLKFTIIIGNIPLGTAHQPVGWIQGQGAVEQQATVIGQPPMDVLPPYENERAPLLPKV